jgi:hypothetical protein
MDGRRGSIDSSVARARGAEKAKAKFLIKPSVESLLRLLGGLPHDVIPAKAGMTVLGVRKLTGS